MGAVSPRARIAYSDGSERAAATLAGVTLDDLVAVQAQIADGVAGLRRDAAAMDRSLSVLERTTGELRQDVTRLGGRVDGLERRLDGIEVRLERIELRQGAAAT